MGHSLVQAVEGRLQVGFVLGREGVQVGRHLAPAVQRHRHFRHLVWGKHIGYG